MRRALADRVGLALFLASWAMLVVALAFAAISLRRAGVWQPLADDVGPWLPLLTVGLVVASSLSLWRGSLRLSLVLGAGFVATQILLLSRAEVADERGRHLIWLLAGFHLAHVLLGSAALFRRAMASKPGGLWCAYWHALAVAWLLFAGVLFL